MNDNRLKTPLIQSAAVIVFGLICFGFVISSGTDSLFGGLWAIITGIFSLILYAIALAVGISICIACLVGIFLGAVFLFSKEQAAIFYSQLKTGLAKLGHEVKDYANSQGCNVNFNIPTPKPKKTSAPVTPESTTGSFEKEADLEQRVADLEAQIAELKANEQRNSAILKELSEKK